MAITIAVNKFASFRLFIDAVRVAIECLYRCVWIYLPYACAVRLKLFHFFLSIHSSREIFCCLVIWCLPCAVTRYCYTRVIITEQKAGIFIIIQLSNWWKCDSFLILWIHIQRMRDRLYRDVRLPLCTVCGDENNGIKPLNGVFICWVYVRNLIPHSGPSLLTSSRYRLIESDFYIYKSLGCLYASTTIQYPYKFSGAAERQITEQTKNYVYLCLRICRNVAAVNPKNEKKSER